VSRRDPVVGARGLQGGLIARPDTGALAVLCAISGHALLLGGVGRALRLQDSQFRK